MFQALLKFTFIRIAIGECVDTVTMSQICNELALIFTTISVFELTISSFLTSDIIASVNSSTGVGISARA